MIIYSTHRPFIFFLFFLTIVQFALASDQDLIRTIKQEFYQKYKLDLESSTHSPLEQSKYIDLINLRIENTNCIVHKFRCGPRNRALKEYNEKYNLDFYPAGIGTFKVSEKIRQPVQDKIFDEVKMDLILYSCLKNKTDCTEYQKLSQRFKQNYDNKTYKPYDLEKLLSPKTTIAEKALGDSKKTSTSELDISQVPDSEMFVPTPDVTSNSQSKPQPQNKFCEWNTSIMKPRLLLSPQCSTRTKKICMGYVTCTTLDIKKNEKIYCPEENCSDADKCYEQYLKQPPRLKISKLQTKDKK